MVAGAEDAEIVPFRPTGRAHEESGIRVIARHFACFAFHGVGFAPNDLRTTFGIFAHRAGIVSRSYTFRELILDQTSIGGFLHRYMDTTVPRVFDRRHMHASDSGRRLCVHATNISRHGQRGRSADHQLTAGCGEFHW
ncbi:hypothetical protein RUM4293_04246 [Ruegeria atlantica]|uniref:Uncharacterized protein n=1 Tax=Ruegeria atlantica TaxID=81569 RepID=A0A0P1E9V2_9RHOB|nr:hypothetical protein RUM4293_04246 [Ruegeria atlantica]